LRHGGHGVAAVLGRDLHCPDQLEHVGDVHLLLAQQLLQVAALLLRLLVLVGQDLVLLNLESGSRV